MVRSSACAVFKLMTSSNFMGCSTGRSPGLAPLRNLVHVDGGSTVVLRVARTVGHESARVRGRGQGVDGRQPMVQGEVGNPCS